MAGGFPAYKTYKIDLDLPPRQRWVHVIQDNLEAMDELVAAYQKALVDEFGVIAPLANVLAGMCTLLSCSSASPAWSHGYRIDFH